MSSDLIATILWLGTPAAISGLIAWLLANWAWFAELTDEKPLLQQGIELLISIAMSVSSMLLAKNVPGDTIKELQPYWAAIEVAINVVIMQAAKGAHVWYQGLMLKREAHNIDLKLSLAEKKARLKVLATTKKTALRTAA